MAASHSWDSDTQEEWTSLTGGHLLDPLQRHNSCMKHASCGLQNHEGSHPQRDSLAACLDGNTGISVLKMCPSLSPIILSLSLLALNSLMLLITFTTDLALFFPFSFIFLSYFSPPHPAISSSLLIKFLDRSSCAGFGMNQYPSPWILNHLH